MSERESIDVLWLLLSAALVFLMQGGFLCLETGVTRAKNNINVAIKNLTDFGVSVVLFWVIGYALMFGSTVGGWVGASGALLDFGDSSAWTTAFFLFQAMFCGTAVTILSGAVAERMRFSAYMVAAALVSVLVYPVFGHWVWNGVQNGVAEGWLRARGFFDFAGSTVVHSTGGWVALAMLLVIGPRSGRFAEDGSPVAIPRSNLPLATLGVVLLWLGWFGFNGGSVLALDERVPLVIANTVVAGGAGLLGALLLGRIVTGKADVELAMNGSLAGLVSVTGSCIALTTGGAFIVGAIGGAIMMASVYLLEAMRVDDAVGAVPVHLGAGIWGTLAVALFGNKDVLGTGLDTWGQVGVQLTGIFVCALWAFALPYVILRGIDRIFPFRVSAADERVGLNISEHGERTDLIDLFEVMNEQATTGDLSLRAPEEPFTEVGRIANRYNQLMASLEVAVEDLRVTTAVKERMESELRIGREIQMSMLPLLYPPFPDRDELSLHAAVSPAREVGGDFYDFFFIDENQLCFCVGDVSGKGVPAALFMAVSKTLIKSRATDEFSSAAILSWVNSELAAENDSAMFVTVFLAILDVKSGELVYTNAGHNPPYIKRADGSLEPVDERHGPVVGALEDLEYREDRTTLSKGDVIFLYTDGVTEAMNTDGALFSKERLADLLESREFLSAEDAVRSTLRSVQQFVEGAEQSDDITLMSVQFLGQPEEAEVPEIFDFVIKNDLAEISRLKLAFAEFAEASSVPSDVVERLHLVFDEILSNIIAYAYRDSDEHEIEIRVELVEDRLTAIVTDDGIPFNPFRYEIPDTTEALEERRVGGLGVHLVRTMMNKVAYQRRIDRNVLSVVKYLNAEEPA